MPIRHKSRERRSSVIEDLRRSIDCLPLRTRQAMLEGVQSEPIIIGAYVDKEGGVCPMMAAHRLGGRTDFLAFAKSWDRFTGAGKRSRRASDRELGVLISHLQASLVDDEVMDLQAAIADHQKLRATRAPARARAYAREAEPTGRIFLRRLRPGRRSERQPAATECRPA